MNGFHAATPFALVAAFVSYGSLFPSRAIPDDARGSRARQEVVQDRKCAPAEFPKALPPVEAILNVATLSQALAADPIARPTGDVTFSMRFLGNGQPEWVRPIGVSSPSEYVRLQAHVAAHTRPQPAAKEPWNVRLQVTGGDSVRYAVGRSHFCPVEQIRVANRGAMNTGLSMASADDMRSLRSGGQNHVTVEVSSTGEILDVRLARSSGNRLQDDIVLQGAREARYKPAIVDGIFVPGRFDERSRISTGTATVRVRVN